MVRPTGEPVEINPSIGAGFKVMTVAEYTSRWKRCGPGGAAQQQRRDRSCQVTSNLTQRLSRPPRSNDDFPDCLSCGSLETKEHHFVQSWCRGKKQWESETFCCQCHAWSWRSYSDPDFLLPEQFERLEWEHMASQESARKAGLKGAAPGGGQLRAAVTA